MNQLLADVAKVANARYRTEARYLLPCLMAGGPQTDCEARQRIYCDWLSSVGRSTPEDLDIFLKSKGCSDWSACSCLMCVEHQKELFTRYRSALGSIRRDDRNLDILF